MAGERKVVVDEVIRILWRPKSEDRSRLLVTLIGGDSVLHCEQKPD